MRPNAPRFRICGAFDLDEAAGAFAPTLIVSMIDHDADALRLATAWDAKHLSLPVPDREREATAPWAIATARTLLTAGAALNADDHVLIHCMAGISRSTAAALLLDLGWTHKATAPSTKDVDDALERLVAARPEAMPNGSLLGAADTILGLKGHLARSRAVLVGRRLTLAS